MTPRDSRFSDSDETSDEPVAPETVQESIAAMLRRSASDDDVPRMPDAVEARLREALRAEGWQASKNADRGAHGVPASADADRASTPRTVVPLPTRRGTSSTRNDDTVAADAPIPAAPSRDASVPPVSRVSSQPRHNAGNGPIAASPGEVRSLDAQRERRRSSGRSIRRAALATGAAAAVALGAVGIWKGLGDSGQQAPTAQQSVSSPDVRVTNSQTAYRQASFTTQAAAMTTSQAPTINSAEDANSAGLGKLSTQQGVNSCVNAIDTTLRSKPQKVYADFGTYQGHPAVIVVVVSDGKKTAWVVNRTCSKASDTLAGPETIST